MSSDAGQQNDANPTARVIQYKCPGCNGVLPPSIQNQPVICNYCDGWSVLDGTNVVAVHPSAKDANRLLQGETHGVALPRRHLSSKEIFAGRTRRHAPKILALPAFFVIAMHVILIGDPQSVPAVPGIEGGHYDLILWFILAATGLFFAKLRLVMAVLCLCAAAANAALTYQWLMTQRNQVTATGYEVTTSWLLQSETGLFYLLGIGAPLLVAIIWAMHQNGLLLKRQLKKRARDGIIALLLAVAGVALAWMALQRPTVHDYAQQFDTELDAIEDRMSQSAHVISERYAAKKYPVFDYSTPLEPLPTYDHKDFKRSNVAVVPINPYHGESWQQVYQRHSKQLLFFPGALAQLLANRHTVYANRLRPIEPYAAALKASWWLLYSVPRTCDKDNAWIRSWLVRASDGEIIYRVDTLCGKPGFQETNDLFKRWAQTTRGSFKF